MSTANSQGHCQPCTVILLFALRSTWQGIGELFKGCVLRVALQVALILLLMDILAWFLAIVSA
jgi:hypothetical protein